MVNESERIKIITNSGYKYFGFEISRDALFVEIDDIKCGRIKIPLSNISFLQEVGHG